MPPTCPVSKTGQVAGELMKPVHEPDVRWRHRSEPPQASRLCPSGPERQPDPDGRNRDKVF